MQSLLAIAAIAQALSGTPESFPVTEPAAMNRICPQYLVRTCVIERDHRALITWTNPCFAHERGWIIVPMHFCGR